MRESLPAALEMVVMIVTFFVKVGLLRVLLDRAARHYAASDFMRAMVVTFVVAGTYDVLAFLFRAPLGPTALLMTFLAGMLAVRVFCWVPFSRGAYISIVFMVVCVAFGYGVNTLFDEAFPERKSFFEKAADAGETFASLRAVEGEPMDWEWLFSRALEGLGWLTQPEELEHMEGDLGRGIAALGERQALLASYADGSFTGDIAMAMSVGMVATGEVAFSSQTLLSLLTLAMDEQSADGSPQDIETSLALLRENLSSAEGRETLGGLLATGSLFLADALAQAQAATNPQHVVDADAAMALLGANDRDAMVGRFLDLLMSEARVETNETGHVSVAFAGRAAKPVGVAADGSSGAGPEDIDLGDVAVTTQGWAIAVTDDTGGTNLTETADEATDAEKAPWEERWHPSHELLRVTGVLSSREGQEMVLCNGVVVERGKSIEVEWDGEQLVWVLDGLDGREPIWRRGENAAGP